MATTRKDDRGKYIPDELDRDYKSYIHLRRKEVRHLLCERWLESYDNFLADMGHRPDPSMQLGRKDVTQGWSPENCEWMTRTQQAAYRRASKCN